MPKTEQLPLWNVFSLAAQQVQKLIAIRVPRKRLLAFPMSSDMLVNLSKNLCPLISKQEAFQGHRTEGREQQRLQRRSTICRSLDHV